MWPFSKKRELHGIKSDRKGDLTFELTEEEIKVVEDVSMGCEGYAIHRSVADDFKRGMTAFALSMYARKQAVASQEEPQGKRRVELLEKAFAAATKAYSIYDLPIYLYDFACFMEMLGRMDIAKGAFREYLTAQSNYKPKSIDNAFLNNRDIAEAVRDAIAKAT